MNQPKSREVRIVIVVDATLVLLFGFWLIFLAVLFAFLVSS